MADFNRAVECAQKFWDHFVAGDIDAFAGLLAPNFTRIGPRDGDPNDTLRGKDEYVKFIRDIKATMPAHGGYTAEVGASPDGTRGFVRCIEYVAVAPGSTEMFEVANILMMHMNDDGLIETVDIYRKDPRREIDWTQAKALSKVSDEMKQ